METINERFSYAIKETGKKKIEIAETIGISSASLSQICSGRTKPSNQTIKSFCDNYGISREWLETGKGEPIRKQTRQQQLAAAFARAMNGTSVSANLIASVALALDRLDDDQAASVVELLTRIIESYGSLESSETQEIAPE